MFSVNISENTWLPRLFTFVTNLWLNGETAARHAIWGKPDQHVCLCVWLNRYEEVDLFEKNQKQARAGVRVTEMFIVTELRGPK